MKTISLCKLVAIASGISLIMGCSTPYTPDLAKRVESKQVVDYNYKVGEPVFASVGEPIVKVQDFTVVSTDSAWVTPDRTITIHAGSDANITLEAGVQYLILGTTLIDGERYSLVQTPFGAPMGGSWLVLVSEDGSLYPRIATLGIGLIFRQLRHTISDPSVQFARGRIEAVDRKASYKNFELIYTGLGSSGLSISYREFDPENINRVSSDLSLTYDADAEHITFRDFKIQINNVSRDAIEVTVLQD
jgi:hypothetical protein